MASIRLVPGHAYRLAAMRADLWVSPHASYGTPPELAGVYLGYLVGTRTWHLFEIRIGGRDAGVVMMHTGDLEQLTITEL